MEYIEPIRRLPDGTIKQVNPFSGTQVWTVPGRGNRPIVSSAPAPHPITPARLDHYCAFCPGRYLETPPEKSRLLHDGDDWLTLTAVPAAELTATTAEFRRVPNLFEIMSVDYWEENHGYRPSAEVRERRRAYLAAPEGLAHVMQVARGKALASGMDPGKWESLSDDDRMAWARNFFDGGHDVVIARRHFVDGAEGENELASSGRLTPEEHFRFTHYTVDAMRELYDFAPDVKYVAVFQNWLRPAGASFDHLHKQLVAIDEVGAAAQREHDRVAANPNIYNELAVNYASDQGLILAQNSGAIAFAGFGHRYPTLEVFSTAPVAAPWEHSAAQVRAVSDLVHACHAATGAEVASNEEWYHQPRGFDVPMPWRVMLKWRISTLAGFEGSTKINVNTISPFDLHDRVLARLIELRREGAIAPMRLGAECTVEKDLLRYVSR
ncbi:Galactose-1-phosphate uridylyltransferase [Ruaniaceae bacterium KH17]|nr:Galactose-1-phosphate uridylyltransferase [Ruaniaceae bacterium KH17]